MTSSHPSQVPIIMHTPIDIIREIFLQCVLAPCRLPPSLKEPRLVLTHVCSAWWEIVLDMPKLWTDIILDPRHPGWSVHGHVIISAWLSRSSPCQISLQISRPANKTSLFRDLILPTLHRCQHLNLRTSGAELQRLLSISAGTLPDLEDIRIYGIGPSWQVVEDLFHHGQVTAFQGCPKLRRIRFFIRTTIQIDLHSLKFPWRQLSALVLRWIRISPISCLNVLRECVLLQECSLSISLIDLAIDTLIVALSSRPLLLPSLHTLSLGLMNHHALFLAALHMPNLRVFCPMDRWDRFRWPLSSLTSSFLRLNALNLTLISAMVEDDLREFLQPFQWLAKLYLPQLDPLTGAALRELSSGALIPSVTSIVFGPIGIEGLIFILEERLVVSQAAGSGISMFTFVSSACIRPTDPGLVARLEVLEATGIQVEFNHDLNLYIW